LVSRASASSPASRWLARQRTTRRSWVWKVEPSRRRTVSRSRRAHHRPGAAEMPAGTVGFRVAGDLTREDDTDMLVPALHAALESGGGLRILYLRSGACRAVPRCSARYWN
jgi:hypothetical protein